MTRVSSWSSATRIVSLCWFASRGIRGLGRNGCASIRDAHEGGDRQPLVGVDGGPQLVDLYPLVVTMRHLDRPWTEEIRGSPRRERRNVGRVGDDRGREPIDRRQ